MLYPLLRKIGGANMEDMKLTPFEDFLNKNFGEIGTSTREAFEKKVHDAILIYKTGKP